MDEPFEEMSQEPSEPFRPQEPVPTEKRARRGLIVGAAALTVLVVLFASHGSAVFHDVIDTFCRPPNGQNTITVSIYMEPIESDLARQMTCDAGFYKNSNTTLAGLPAFHFQDSWIVESSGAHFQINYVYPNDPGNVASPPSPTPMPPGFYARGQQEWQAILASFMPTPDTPLKCN